MSARERRQARRRRRPGRSGAASRYAALLAGLFSAAVTGLTVLGTAPASAAAVTSGTAALLHVNPASAGYTIRGTKVSGADQLSEQAPLLTPGQYVDTYAKGSVEEGGSAVPGTTKFYTVPIQKNANLYVSATIVDPANARADRGTTLGVKIKLRARDNYSCKDAYSSESQSDDRATIATAVLAATPGQPSWSDRCPTSGVGILEVQRTGSAYTNNPASVEMVVRYEPGADATGLPKGFEGDQPVLAKPTFTSGGTITPGSSFNDAATLSSGATYQATMTTGQSQYYRIPLKWGQRFTYLIEQTNLGANAPDSGATVRAEFSNPLRQRITTTDSTTSETWFSKAASEPMTGSSKVPVRYTNRTSPSSSAAGYEFDGAYYLSLTADSPPTTLTTRYRILVVISGAPEAGPRYQSLPQGAATTGSAASTGGAIDPAGAAESQTGADSGDTTTLTIVMAIVAALGGAGLTVLVMQLRSRKQSAQGPQA